jgi:hypothetical protein
MFYVLLWFYALNALAISQPMAFPRSPEHHVRIWSYRTSCRHNSHLFLEEEASSSLGGRRTKGSALILCCLLSEVSLRALFLKGGEWKEKNVFWLLCYCLTVPLSVPHMATPYVGKQLSSAEGLKTVAWSSSLPWERKEMVCTSELMAPDTRLFV